MTLLTFCDICTDYTTNDQKFSSSTFCTDYNFYIKDDFIIDTLNTDNLTKFHKFQYKDLFCIFVPNLTTPNKNFSIENMLTPEGIGLRWSSQSVSVLSEESVLILTK